MSPSAVHGSSPRKIESFIAKLLTHLRTTSKPSAVKVCSPCTHRILFNTLLHQANSTHNHIGIVHTMLQSMHQEKHKIAPKQLNPDLQRPDTVPSALVPHAHKIPLPGLVSPISVLRKLHRYMPKQTPSPYPRAYSCHDCIHHNELQSPPQSLNLRLPHLSVPCSSPLRNSPQHLNGNTTQSMLT
jgi:hypothetical protein